MVGQFFFSGQIMSGLVISDLCLCVSSPISVSVSVSVFCLYLPLCFITFNYSLGFVSWHLYI